MKGIFSSTPTRRLNSYYTSTSLLYIYYILSVFIQLSARRLFAYQSGAVRKIKTGKQPVTMLLYMFLTSYRKLRTIDFYQSV